MKKGFLIIMLVLVLLPLNIMAEENETSAYYTNNNGVSMNEEEYNIIVKMYGEGYAALMTESQFEYFQSLNITLNNLNQTVKYIKTEYDNVTGEVINTEITEKEYNDVIIPDQTKSMTVETTYKKMSLTLTSIDSTTADITFATHWKLMPVTRSFDVNAMRFINFDDINGTQAGDQFYVINGNYYGVSYGWNGTNINRQSNGFGISMNLVDSTSITSFDLIITSLLSITGSNPIAYASYQHATSNVTLAQSKNYTLGAGGLGSVIIFNNNIGNYYDGTTGLYATL